MVRTPRPKKYNTRVLYFTDRLRDSMELLSDYPCTMVEAPMGYGKTTAVREALHSTHAKVLWQTIYDGDSAAFWLGFCSFISKLDKNIAGSLQQIGLPTDMLLRHEAVTLLRNLKIFEPTFFVIDDCHFIKAPEVSEFLGFFLKNLPEKLHIVIISRTAFLKNLSELQLKGFVNRIGAEELELSPSDIAKYYRLCGITLTEEERDLLYTRSEGWISALYLFMLEYTAKGAFTPVSDIRELVYQTVYLPLNDELKTFLNYICLFDSFSIKQAQCMWPKNNAPTLLFELQTCNAFITRDRLTDEYHLHNIFTICIREEFTKLSESTQRELWQRAGEWHFLNQNHVAAMDCYFKSMDFDQMLCAFEKDKSYRSDGEYKEKLISYFSSCPEQIRVKHHYALLFYARRLFVMNEHQLFGKTCAEVRRNIEMDQSLEPDARDTLLGEYEIVMNFASYNSISKMLEHSKKACLYFKTPSGIFDNIPNWTFGSPSVLYMFYRESGKLSEDVERLKEAMSYYYQATDGHGSGAEYLMEAEAYFLRGEFQNAEISVYKCIPSAQSKAQWSILLCADYLLARIALIQGDYSAAATLLKNMRETLKTQKRYTLLRTVDICEAYIQVLVGQPQKSAEWILQGELSDIKMLMPALPALQMVYGRILLENKKYTKLIGLSNTFLKMASIFPNLLSHIYIHIHLAAVYEKLFNRDEAIVCLKNALAIAVPDQLYMPFAENGKYICDLFEDPRISATYTSFSAQFRKLNGVFNQATTAVQKSFFLVVPTSLSEREKEVAGLAAKGLSNKAIGKTLFITENTVKARLKSVYEKLSVKSRAQLEERLFPKSLV